MLNLCPAPTTVTIAVITAADDMVRTSRYFIATPPPSDVTQASVAGQQVVRALLRRVNWAQRRFLTARHGRSLSVSDGGGDI
jgi:hypothetical protein